MQKTIRAITGVMTLAAAWSVIQAPPVSAASPTVTVVFASITSVVAPPSDKESVLSFLRTYESTLATGRVERIVNLYADFDPARRPEMEDYFERVVSHLTVRLDDVRIRVDGDSAQVKFDRTDSFTDRESGLPVQKNVALARHLERQGPGWRLVLDGR